MQTIESGGWLGDYLVNIRQKDGTEEQHTINNRITNAGLNAMRDVLNGDINDLEIKYIALGTSDAPLNDADTTLGNEQFRKEFISTAKPSLGQLQKTALILDSEAVFHIKEIGIFAGNATNVTDSGVLISRVLFDRNKTNLESIQFVRRDTFVRG
jgi:hypothetical protein